MLTALISSIIGLAGGVLPAAIKMLERRQDDKSERELIKLRHTLEMERLREQASQKIQETQYALQTTEVASWTEGVKAAIAAQPVNTGFVWVDALNAALRPTTTVVLLVLFSLSVIGLIAPEGAFAVLLIESVQAVLGFLFGYRCLAPKLMSAR